MSVWRGLRWHPIWESCYFYLFPSSKAKPQDPWAPFSLAWITDSQDSSGQAQHCQVYRLKTLNVLILALKWAREEMRHSVLRFVEKERQSQKRFSGAPSLYLWGQYPIFQFCFWIRNGTKVRFRKFSHRSKSVIYSFLNNETVFFWIKPCIIHAGTGSIMSLDF